MRDKFFTYSDRVTVYAEGKHAFNQGRLRSFNPYAKNKEFAELWWHGWDTAKRKIKAEGLPIDQGVL